MDIETGGPAFPSKVIESYQSVSRDGFQSYAEPIYKNCEGMTLRDWFAGQALAGMMGHPDLSIEKIMDRQLDRDALAKMCFAAADAMLKARKGE